MLSKFAELAGVEITIWHLVDIFAPIFYWGTMLNLRRCGGKFLVVKMDDNGSRQFWLDFFFVKTECRRFP